MDKLSEILRRADESGDSGKALEGYPEMAEKLEQENAELKQSLNEYKDYLREANADGAAVKKLQAGRTSRQMINAPQGAIYVCEKSDLDYNKRLARWLHREDLTIRASRKLNMYREFCAVRNNVVIDHAVYVTPAQKAMLDRRWPFIDLSS